MDGCVLGLLGPIVVKRKVLVGRYELLIELQSRFEPVNPVLARFLMEQQMPKRITLLSRAIGIAEQFEQHPIGKNRFFLTRVGDRCVSDRVRFISQALISLTQRRSDLDILGPKLGQSAQRVNNLLTLVNIQIELGYLEP